MNKCILEVKDLKRWYSIATPNGEKRTYSVLKGISFQVQHGEFIGIMGSSGCGKTTLLKTMGMLNKPNEGSILYKGKDTKTIYGDRLSQIRRTEIAFVFQDFYLMDSLTVKENIMMPLILNEDNPTSSAKIAVQVAERLRIGDLLDKKPYELSGGEKQRTAIGRALAANPELILADEPTGNLDSNSSKQVLHALSYINSTLGKTIVMVTHDPKMACYCDKVILLKDGKMLDILVKDGTNKEFFKTVLRKMTQL